MKYGKFGKYLTFQITNKKIVALNNLSGETGAVWYEHERNKGKPLSEYGHPSLKKYTLEIQLVAAGKLKPQTYINKVMKLCENGTVAPLVVGGRILLNKAYIESVNCDMPSLTYKGKAYVINATVVMSEYGCKQKSKKKTKKKTSQANQTNNSTQTSGNGAINVYYRIYAGKWYGEVKNCSDTSPQGYAGIEKKAMSGLMVKLSKGIVSTRAHLKNANRWLPWVTGYTVESFKYGYAGIPGQSMDGVQIKLSGLPGYEVKYRVSTVDSKGWMPWITGANGYAGTFGKEIDKIQIKVVKK